jgi:hypothetical protein
MVAAQVWRAIQRADQRGKMRGQRRSLIIPRTLPGRTLIIAHPVSVKGTQAPALPHAPSQSAPLTFGHMT